MFNNIKYKDQKTHKTEGIEFKVIYSKRRTLGISVLPDSSVVVRVPYLTSYKTISRIVQQKSDWIIKHRDSYKRKEHNKSSRLFIDGELHLFRGKKSVLRIKKSNRPYILFKDSTIELGLGKTDDDGAIKKLLNKNLRTLQIRGK